MRFILYLKEEYIDTLLGIKKPYTVYKNPTPSDINRLHKDIISMFNDESYGIRGLIDVSNKDIYILPARADLHKEVYEKLKSKNELASPPHTVLKFIGYIDNNRIYGESLESFTGNTIDKKIKLDWLKRFVANADTIEMDEISAFASFK